MRHADWLIDIGPGPGKHGGQVLFSGAPKEIPELPRETILQSPTLTMLTSSESTDRQLSIKSILQNEQAAQYLEISGACVNNLQHIDVAFRLNALNVVTGVSGAGKSSLTIQVLGDFMQHHLEGKSQLNKTYQSISGFESIRKLIVIDQSPIGRTPRSNPATYTGVFDLIRDLFARQPEAVRLGFDKSRFSFNTEGGRCEACQGAGYQQVGMHFLGSVEVPCDQCEGKRFDEATLSVTWQGKSISDILEMTIEEAIGHFRELPGIVQYLETLDMLGLGYLSLGQRSSTLSGGEAQRVKLASELARPSSAHTLYLMDEPTTGLHASDVKQLMKALEKLVEKGHTIVVMEHHPELIRRAAHIIDLGPGSGKHGGKVVFSGPWSELLQCESSLTGKALKGHSPLIHEQSNQVEKERSTWQDSIEFKGVATHNLKNIDISISHRKLTVVTGISGSGKSSLIFDTLHATAQNRYLDGFSAWVRARLSLPEAGVFDSVEGLTPTLAISQQKMTRNPRSTVGTLSGMYDLIRLLFARCGTHISSSSTPRPHSGIFSFNHHAGACPVCKGLGTITRCDPEKLITHPERPLPAGAMDGNRTGKFYGDPSGQYMATLHAVGLQNGFDYSIPWNELPEKAKELAIHGTGDQEYQVTWEYRRGKREGQHHFKGTWPGLAGLVELEYQRKHADYRGDEMITVMTETPCETCLGSRLCDEALEWRVAGADIAAVVDLQVDSAITYFSGIYDILNEPALKEAAKLATDEIIARLQILSDLGLAYLTMARSIDSLSDGEERRVRLAAVLTSGLTGITCIFDEPTTGLHPQDVRNLMTRLGLLRDSGNTVVLVEHDPEVIRQADHVIDLGPGAGVHGGTVVFSGIPALLGENKESLTGHYTEKKVVTTPIPANLAQPGLTIRKVSRHNLKGFDLSLPGAGLIVVTGVSGSGKSSLVFDVIHRSWLESKPSGCMDIDGFQLYNQVIAGIRTGRGISGLSVVATWCGIFDSIRTMMASQPEAQSLNMGKNYFSFLNREGQCPACEGRGEIRTSMDFLPDLVSTCETCHGSRYNDHVLKVLFEQKNVADILAMPVSEAISFFRDEKKIQPALNLLNELGLAYLTLGQEVSSLSGGEFQRLELAVSLMTPAKARTLWMFDEPSAGLHPHDVEMLLKLFRRLVERGDTVLVTEHDPMIIAAAGYLVELGPGGGEAGGFLIKAGIAGN
jgi:excinuclease ABC subunit A